MNQKEFEHWLKVTASSEYRWVEDEITRLNGRGALYYTGGENGIYMRLSPDGKLTAGTYEGAIPHIGEALFTQKTEHQYASFSEASQAALEFGGIQFLVDMLSSDRIPQIPPPDEESAWMGMDMTM
ncbi:MAG TPA: hypothetical protein DD735_01125 [Clostridiales bacterium]|jgi:hypothetical protein|nr:hypothetical protein [Clostridiales bacterium]HCG34724.1 hypothetical protein [Clostridiales bacterium]